MVRSRPFLLTLVALLALPSVAVGYKIFALGFDVEDALPLTRYNLRYEFELDGGGSDVRVRTFLPRSDQHQSVSDERDTGELRLTIQDDGSGNREAVWFGSNVPDRVMVQHEISVVGTALEYDLPDGLVIPDSYPSAVSSQLQPEDAVQSEHPEVVAFLAEIRANEGSVVERLRRIFDATSALPQRPFKGLTDALTALRLGEASCNGKSRLFVALARAAGIPARLVGGLILEPGTKRTSHQWVEAWVGGHWVPFGPTNDHFAELPANYLVLYRGDRALFRHTTNINFEYSFSTTTTLVPPPAARSWLPAINVWALFERLGLSFHLLRTLLLLPIGALVVVIFRNVIGLPTFGTFLPALLAAAAGSTGPAWGVFGVLIVVTIVALVRWLFHRLQLLHSPMLAILLAAVVTTMLGVSLVAEQVGAEDLAYLTIFPIAVLAITAERFYLSMTERGLRDAVSELGGTLLVMIACYVVMSSLALQVIVIGFPEIILVVVAADLYLGRWVGLRLSEYLRFRKLLAAR